MELKRVLKGEETAVVFTVFLGLVFTHLSIFHLIAEEESLSEVLLGVVPALIFSTILIYAGYRLWISDLNGPQSWRIVPLELLGGSIMTIQALLFIGHQISVGVELKEANVLVTTSATGGTLLGFIAGIYYLKSKTKTTEIQEKNESLEVLNRLVRHDIRNDMNVVLGWGKILREYVEPGGEEILERILGASKQVTELTDVARDYVEIITGETPPELEPIVLVDSLNKAVDNCGAKYPNATFKAEGEIPEVEVEVNDLLTTVFRNLLNNAVKHNDKDSPLVQISAKDTGDSVIVSVADNGPGIPDDRKEAIFGKGWMGHESDGTGMGVYLVHTIVTQFGGKIWVEDNEPEGSVFNVELRKAP